MITGVLGYRSARWNLRKELEVDLRRQRLEAFKQLWALSEPLAKYGRTGPVTPASMEKLSADLSHWYFAQGGMFLSEESRETCFLLQKALQEVIHGAVEKDRELDTQTREGIAERSIRLRDSLGAAFKGFPRM